MTTSEDSAEACGRCAMSSVTGAMDEGPDPYDGERIELADAELRRLSPSVWLAGVRRRLDALVTRVTYGK